MKIDGADVLLTTSAILAEEQVLELEVPLDTLGNGMPIAPFTSEIQVTFSIRDGDEYSASASWNFVGTNAVKCNIHFTVIPNGDVPSTFPQDMELGRILGKRILFSACVISGIAGRYFVTLQFILGGVQ